MENDEELKSKFSNIFIMLLLSIQTGDIDNVKHFLTEELYKEYKNICDVHRERNEMQLYDEANVKDIRLVRKYDEEDCHVIEVELTSRYMDYIISLDTGRKISGVNDHRIELTHTLVFKKRFDAVRGSVVKCAGCGANLDVNFTGKCEYCGTVHSAEKYDYILTSIN
jgi:hypothetical protein